MKRIAAGVKHEKEVAYYLDRALADHKGTFLFNNIRFEQAHGNVQIDHLVLHPYGFVLIESKSVYGEIKVNSENEWSRSFNGKWYGMKSPIQQASLQKEALLKLLTSRKNELLGKALGVLSYGFKGRHWDVLTAVSSTAIIDRDNLPKAISSSVLKSEFIGEKIRSVLKPDLTAPSFNKNQMDNLVSFLSSLQQPIEMPDTSNREQSPNSNKPESSQELFFCKHCGHGELEGAYGKYGYYGVCTKCKKNTSLPHACPSCGSNNGKPRKKKTTYYFDCQECSIKTDLIT
jgi:hypothetical protein